MGIHRVVIEVQHIRAFSVDDHHDLAIFNLMACFSMLQLDTMQLICYEKMHNTAQHASPQLYHNLEYTFLTFHLSSKVASQEAEK